MTTVPAKHVIKFIAAFARVAALTANGASTVVTSAITTALSTAGDGGVSVPLQVAASIGLGVLTTAPNNRCEVYSATSDDKIFDGSAQEVYGRLTEASGVYTLSYFTLADSGVETVYTFSSATPIDFEFGYRFDFARLPSDAIIGTTVRNVSQDPSAAAGKVYLEQLLPSAPNTLPNLSKKPVSDTTFKLMVNGIVYDTFGGGSARVAVNTTTKAVTWSSANAGFAIETTDRVIAEYQTNE